MMTFVSFLLFTGISLASAAQQVDLTDPNLKYPALLGPVTEAVLDEGHLGPVRPARALCSKDFTTSS